MQPVNSLAEESDILFRSAREDEQFGKHCTRRGSFEGRCLICSTRGDHHRVRLLDVAPRRTRRVSTSRRQRQRRLDGYGQQSVTPRPASVRHSPLLNCSSYPHFQRRRAKPAGSPSRGPRKTGDGGGGSYTRRVAICPSCGWSERIQGDRRHPSSTVVEVGADLGGKGSTGTSPYFSCSI